MSRPKVAAGGVRRTAGPATKILARLNRFADLDDGSLEPIDGADETAAAWNRFVHEVRDARRTRGLESRLGDLARGGREKRTARVLDALAEGVAATDRDGAVTYCNAAFAALAGQAAAGDLLGRPIGDLLAGIAADEPLPAELATPGPRPAAGELRRGPGLADGVAWAAAAPLSDEAGGLAGHVWTLRDVTQARMAEAARNDFVRSASHELRTPLANIKAYAETLLDYRDSCRRRGGALKLGRLNALCGDILRITGLAAQSEIYDDALAAVGSFAR